MIHPLQQLMMKSVQVDLKIVIDKELIGIKIIEDILDIVQLVIVEKIIVKKPLTNLILIKTQPLLIKKKQLVSLRKKLNHVLN